jgi:thiamine biosynthesis protein ThiS
VIIVFEKDNSTKKLSFDGTVEELLKRLKINPETVIVARNKTIVDETEQLNNDDTITILNVISGG